MAKLVSTGTVKPTISSMQPKRRRRQPRSTTPTVDAGAIVAGDQDNFQNVNENSPNDVLEHEEQDGRQNIIMRKDDHAALPNSTPVVPVPTRTTPQTTTEQQQQLRRKLCSGTPAHCFDPEERNVFSPPVPPAAPTMAPTTLSQRAQEDDENCVSDGAGNYGPTTESSSFRTVKYYYQLETTTALADVTLLNIEVLQDVEKAISDRLVKRFFKETCTTAPVIDVSSPNNNQDAMNDMIDGLTLGAATTTPIPPPSSASPATTPSGITNIQVTHHDSSTNTNNMNEVLSLAAATIPPSSSSPSVPLTSPGEITNIQVTHHEGSTNINTVDDVLVLDAATTPPSPLSASNAGDISNIQVTTTSNNLNEVLTLGAATTPPSSSSASNAGDISNIQVTTTTNNLNEVLTLGADTTPPSASDGITNIQVTSTTTPPSPPSPVPASSNPWGITNIQVAVSNPFKDEQAPLDGLAAKGGGLRRLQDAEQQQPVVGLTAAPLDQVLEGSLGEACPFPTTDGPCFVIGGGVTFFGGNPPDGPSTESDGSSALSWIDQIVHEELKIGMNSGSLENAVRTEQPDVVAIRYIPAGTELPNNNGSDNNPGGVEDIGGRSTSLSWVLMGIGFLLLAVVFCYMYIARRQQKREEEEERNAFVVGAFPVTVTSASLGRRQDPDALYRNGNNFPETASSHYSASPAKITRSGVSYGYATDDEGFPLHVFQDDNNNSPQQLPQGVSTSWRDQILRYSNDDNGIDGSLDPNRAFVRPVLNDEGHSYYRSPETQDYGSGSYESSSFASSPRSRMSPSKLTVAFERREVI